MTDTGSDKHILVNRAEAEEGDETASALRIRDLVLDLPEGKRILSDFNLTLNKGDRMVLTGKNGSGKSTLIKAICNLWDDGAGEITLPAGAKVMSISQKAHFPNTTLRGILNAPCREGYFEDEKLAGVLHGVDHDRLIQHIPGAQVKITMDRILDKLPCYLDDYENMRCTPQEYERMKYFLGNMTENTTLEDFDFVQYVPEAQREYFRSRFDEIQQEYLSHPLSAEQVEELASHMIDKMDQALVSRLIDKLTDKCCNTAKMYAPAASPSKSRYFMWRLHRNFNRNIKRYMANKDTDDLSRPIKINAQQAAYVEEKLLGRIEEKLGITPKEKSDLPSLFDSLAHDLVDNITDEKEPEQSGPGRLRTLFNALTWPVSVFYQPRQAKKAARDIMQETSVFMGTQTVTGKRFATRLSGGEQQRLMFARILLHKPDVLLLDEITAALDESSADTLYRNMVEKLPETIMISISHDKHIIKHHTHHATLDPDKQAITVRKLQP